MSYRFSMKPYIIVCSWIVFCIFWIISSRFVKSTKEVKRDYSPFWFYSGILFFMALLTISFFNYTILSITVSNTVQLIGTIVVVTGVIVAIIARSTLAKNWSGNIEIKVKHELITTGIYRLIRHPIYAGILSMSLGTLLFTANISSLLLFLIMLIFLILKLKEEEEVLMKHFPNKYHKYQEETYALIPYLW
jgi:protein-S-isoprenylcysteine O-methyltransferase Ste14